MKAALTSHDLERLPPETRVAIDALLSEGASIDIVSQRACRKALKSAPLSTWDRQMLILEGPVTRGDLRSGKPDFHGLDEWNGRTQAVVPVHVERPRYFDFTAMNELLKQLYSDQAIENVAYRRLG